MTSVDQAALEAMLAGGGGSADPPPDAGAEPAAGDDDADSADRHDQPAEVPEPTGPVSADATGVEHEVLLSPPAAEPIAAARDEPVPAERPELEAAASMMVAGDKSGSTERRGDEPALRPSSGIDLVEKMAAGCRRDDLIERIRLARQALAGAEARVVVAGEYKQGKSSLVNALLGCEICPVDGVQSTTVPTILRYGDELTASWVGIDDRVVEIASPGHDEDALRAAILEGSDHEERRDAAAIEVRLPRRLLAAGISLIDTPGVGGLTSAEAAAVAVMASSADAVLFVSDLTQELTAPELEYLADLAERTPDVICVFTKSDLTTSGVAIVERNRGHLVDAGLAHLPHAVVSSALHSHALEGRDPELEAESGFGPLIDLLRRRALDRAKQRLATSARDELELISSQLELEADAAQRAADGEAAEVAAELGDATRRTVSARAESADWRKELASGVKHLQIDAQQDRQRRRLAINRWIDNVFADETGDDDAELDDDEFIELLHRQVLIETAAHFDHVQGLIDELTATVHQRYASESLDPIDVAVSTDYQPNVDPAAGTGRHPAGGRTRGLLAVAQSSTSGMVVASTAVGVSTTSLSLLGASMGAAAIALGPLLLGAPVGVLFAMRAVRDDRRRRRELTAHELRKRANTYVQEAWLDFEYESRRSIDEAQTLLREAIELRSRQVEQTLVHAAAAAERIGRAREAGELESDLGERIGKGRRALEAMRHDRRQLAGAEPA